MTARIAIARALHQHCAVLPRPHPRLVRLVLLTQLPALATWAALVAVRHAGEHRQLQEQAGLQAQALALAVAERLESVDRQLQMLAAVLGDGEPDPATFGRHARLTESLAGLDGIVLATPRGAPLLDTRGGIQAQPVLPAAAAAAPNGPGFAIPPARGAVIVTAPVLRDGDARFLLMATLDRRRFEALIAQRGLPASTSAALLDGGGALVARLPDAAPGGTLLTATRTVPARGWTAVVSVPASGSAAMLWRSVRDLLPFALLPAFLLWFAWRLHRRTVPATQWKASEQRTEIVLESVDEAVVYGDKHLCIERLNGGAARMFGVEAGALRGQPVTRLIAPETLEELLHHADRRSRDRQHGRVAGWGRRGDGGMFPIECSLTRWTDAEGRATSTFTARDATAGSGARSVAAARTELLQRMNQAFQRELQRQTELCQQAIARELHDAVGSSLAGIGLLLATARRLAQETRAEPLIARCQEQVTRTIQQIGRISRSMMPAGQERGGLLPALEQFALDTSVAGAVTCTVRVRGEFSDVPPLAATHLFRIVQEATGNALRHGKARHVRIRLVQYGQCFCLGVSDDGAGCDPSLLAGLGSGLGVRSMRMRAHSIGGRLQLRSRPGHGLLVRVTWSAAGLPASPQP